MIDSSRDNFSARVKRVLALRVNYLCSNPDCRAQTSGPQVDAEKAVNVGVAAHVAGAAEGGPRYEADMTAKARSSIFNAIWLCQNCAKKIDSDPIRFTVELLKEWKEEAEREASERAGKKGKTRR